jgi:hypothetical protein
VWVGPLQGGKKELDVGFVHARSLRALCTIRGWQ